MLGAILQGCFKDEAHLHLHSFPSPSVKTGSFVHDIFITEPSWSPNSDEMRTISAEMIKLAAKNLKIERLEVSYDLALEMFKDNPYKKEQLPFIKGSTSTGKFHVYLDLLTLRCIASCFFNTRNNYRLSCWRAC